MVLKVHVALDHLPFSAGIPPTEEAGLIGKINTEIDHDFQESDQLRGHARRVFTDPGRLSRTVLNLERAADVDQAVGQLESMPGADIWMSLTCTYHSPLQHLNEANLRKAKKRTMKMLDLAIPFLEHAIQNNGRIGIEYPRSSLGNPDLDKLHEKA